jgi:hypothetical protein
VGGFGEGYRDGGAQMENGMEMGTDGDERGDGVGERDGRQGRREGDVAEEFSGEKLAHL